MSDRVNLFYILEEHISVLLEVKSHGLGQTELFLLYSIELLWNLKQFDVVVAHKGLIAVVELLADTLYYDVVREVVYFLPACQHWEVEATRFYLHSVLKLQPSVGILQDLFQRNIVNGYPELQFVYTRKFQLMKWLLYRRLKQYLDRLPFLPSLISHNIGKPHFNVLREDLRVRRIRVIDMHLKYLQQCHQLHPIPHHKVNSDPHRVLYWHALPTEECLWLQQKALSVYLLLVH